MSPREQLSQNLQDVAAIKALIGNTEHLYLDCKVWPPKEDDLQRILAKAFCGFANADGGVVVVGLEARAGQNKDDPDLIQQARPVQDALAVKSRIENLIGQLVEPVLEGVKVATVYDPPDSKSGFVLIDIPRLRDFPAGRAKTGSST